MTVGIPNKDPFSLKSRLFWAIRPISILLFVFSFCPDLWAAQDAIISSEQAVIYADEQMSSPVGYVARGKRVRIGNIARNKAKVYPIVVSGKIAYIKATDVSTLQADLVDGSVSTERFLRESKGERVETSVSIMLENYNSQIALDGTNGGFQDKDAVDWKGLSLRGHGLVRQWELQLLVNYMTAAQGQEEFKMAEAGVGGAYRFFEWKNFALRLEGQFAVVPWASYALGSAFRVNGTGFTTGGGLGLALRITERWGLDAHAGMYYTRLSGFDAPAPYVSIQPIFYGPRLGAGIHYAFQ